MTSKLITVNVPEMYLDFLHQKAANCVDFWDTMGKPEKSALWDNVTDAELIVYCLARFSEVLANE